MTISYRIVVDNTGCITNIQFRDCAPAVGLPVDPGTFEISSEDYDVVRANMDGYYFESGTIFAKPPQPSPNHVFDYTIKDWVLDESIAITAARQQRNALLLASDWTQLPDVPLATKEAWVTYRQALRDITDQKGYPLNINWPITPGN
jgi:hypothetical protein